MMRFGLSEHIHTLLRNVFQGYSEIEEVRVFGSRAMNKHQNYSDIDLVIFGNIDTLSLGRLAVELDELPLPQTFDVQAYAQITHPDLKKHIDQFGKIIFQQHTSKIVKDPK
ncbi:MAG: nucleotidyltransferase domain-containing protein [Candidatus Latescibacterota bacterium]|jgi:predicted nucleotidyltransferase